MIAATENPRDANQPRDELPDASTMVSNTQSHTSAMIANAERPGYATKPLKRSRDDADSTSTSAAKKSKSTVPTDELPHKSNQAKELRQAVSITHLDQLPHELLTMVVDYLSLSDDVRALQSAMNMPFLGDLWSWFTEQWIDRKVNEKVDEYFNDLQSMLWLQA